MPHHILTGTPGAGKTVVLRALELAGCVVVEEAATDVIALEQARGHPEPWTRPDFVDLILGLQQRRERGIPPGADPVFLDRSPVCTLALSRYSGLPTSPLLAAELERIAADQPYSRDVYFVANLGSVEPTAARRISFDDALVFERIHRETYLELGFRLVDIPAGPVDERAAVIQRAVGHS